MEREGFICPNGCGPAFDRQLAQQSIHPPILRFRPTCHGCGALMLGAAEQQALTQQEHRALMELRRNALNRSQGVQARVVGLNHPPSGTLGDVVALYDHIERLEANPVALLERRIATATLDELDALNQALDALGTRMVERAAELRRRLKDA